MPRTLPWEKKGEPSTVTRPKRPVVIGKVAIENKQKARGTAAESEPEEESRDRRSRKELPSETRPPNSSSPPPEPALESFMNEGLDEDDGFRMVEDEFLAVAQKFTVHLHAAEYKRQQKMVKSRNAETINSISRPVTGKMPDTTRRQVEAMARTKTQGAALENLLSKKPEDGGISDDSDDGGVLPYFGTTLHGLMDSPRRKSASIAKPGTITASTRAAAGFDKPATHSRPTQKSMLGSPKPKGLSRSAQAAQVEKGIEQENSDDDDDDDLDAPILAPKLPPPNRNPSQTTPVDSTSSLPPKANTSQSFPPSKPTSSTLAAPVKKESSLLSFDDVPNFLSTQRTSRVSRLERARQLKAKQETDEQGKRKLGDIPSFF